MSWTINGSTFADLGLTGLNRTRISQATDTVSCHASGVPFDGTALFQYGATVVIKKDDDLWFTGRVTSIPRQGGPSDEHIMYELSGPWWYLEKCVYQQAWAIYDDGSLENTTKSRVVLNQGDAGTPVTSGQQIVDAINWAISRGAPIALGEVDPDIEIPYDEQVDITCSEVIRKMLRWSPDCVCWFDYSAATPIFNCRSRANLTEVSVTIPGPESIQVTPRHDLVIPGCVLRYEQTHTTDVDGQSLVVNSVVVDSAGDTEQLSTIISTIELAGSNTTMSSQTIITEPFPADLNDKAWWLSHVPALKNLDQNYLEIKNASRTLPAGGYPRILKEGIIHDWMGVAADEDTITATIDYLERDSDGNEQKGSRPETFTVIATDAVTGTNNERTYRHVVSAELAEDIPQGVAAALYAGYSQLQYDGRVTLIEQEVSGAVELGQLLNVNGGLAEWTTMDAMVQRISENVDNGHTSITIGPTTHLEIDDLISLLHTFRRRRISFHYRERTTGEASGGAGGQTTISGPVAKNEPSGAPGIIKHLVLATATKQITLDPASLPAGATELKAREIQVCVDGEPMTITFLCSAPY